ncbi:MAG: type II toxin-antitoxin system death-on-curing family toxin [Planctomycetaceae bacterium]|nr:type II toxin-antitoxin system death-on-curing family toxin [Planctomycetaceae bacterium]HRX78212.1 type II toxin-antitoxin system death-on-curing family toxin [Pirellulaceae bacterium]
MRYLTLSEVLSLHRGIIEQSGGAAGIRDLGSIESAVAQPQLTFGGEELYRTIESKATAICFSLVMNHGFVDGNKRIGHAAMETFLVLNGFELVADVDGAERIILALAAGKLSREELLAWVSLHTSRLRE